ncbi:NHLP bacteriocin system secretion protein [Catenovulum sediminis]|uniref:NHLP bacteriocin system secretion protein n=1 Tax=Catenovulum sediminis TaxID=1740262 RepID=A0ABV1RI85_9ALTE
MLEDKSKKLFRQSVLDKLSSPEQLDLLISVTSSRGWLALLACAILIFFAVAWGIWGKVPTNVHGNCILLKSGGIFGQKSHSVGLISDLAVREGDRVFKGQLLARIEQPDLLERLKNAIKTRDELKEKNLFSKKMLELKSISIREDIEYLEKTIKSKRTLLEDGLITEQQLQIEKQNLQRKKSELNGIPIQLVEQENVYKELVREIDSLKAKLEQSSKVFSRHSGRVTEVLVETGQLVSAGTRMFNIELEGPAIKNLEALVLVSAAEGKKINSGMDVSISPSTVRREEHGSLLGRVINVSPYPVTSNSLMQKLENEELIRMLTGGQSMIALTVDLKPSKSTYSGYQWTSPKGPDTALFSGTVCSALVKTEAQAPIKLVIPALKKILGG